MSPRTFQMLMLFLLKRFQTFPKITGITFRCTPTCHTVAILSGVYSYRICWKQTEFFFLSVSIWVDVRDLLKI